MSRIPSSLCALLLLSQIGCRDVTNATGALGRIDYSLASNFEIAPDDLRKVSLLTGYTQDFTGTLTRQGEEDLDHEDPGALRHVVSPSDGAILHSHLDDSEVPGFDLTVKAPGRYRVESMLDDELFDYVDLTFEKPSDLEALTWLRGPTEEAFTETTQASPTVTEGSQAVFLVVPLDGAGERILGSLDPDIEADPEWMVVRDYNVIDAYERLGVVGAVSTCSIYFIDPGSVDVTLIDDVNDVETTRRFEVEAIPR